MCIKWSIKINVVIVSQFSDDKLDIIASKSLFAKKINRENVSKIIIGVIPGCGSDCPR